MNHWTVPLEWNGGMEYWNDLAISFLKQFWEFAMALSL